MAAAMEFDRAQSLHLTDEAAEISAYKEIRKFFYFIFYTKFFHQLHKSWHLILVILQFLKR